MYNTEIRKVVNFHAMKVYRSLVTLLSNLNMGTGCGWLVTSRPDRFTPASIKQEVERSPEWVCTLQQRTKYFDGAGIRSPDRTARSLISMSASTRTK